MLCLILTAPSSFQSTPPMSRMLSYVSRPVHPPAYPPSQERKFVLALLFSYELLRSPPPPLARNGLIPLLHTSSPHPAPPSLRHRSVLHSVRAATVPSVSRTIPLRPNRIYPWLHARTEGRPRRYLGLRWRGLAGPLLACLLARSLPGARPRRRSNRPCYTTFPPRLSSLNQQLPWGERTVVEREAVVNVRLDTRALLSRRPPYDAAR